MENVQDKMGNENEGMIKYTSWRMKDTDLRLDDADGSWIIRS